MSDEPLLESDDETIPAAEPDDWSADHRSGVIAVIGRPNVGKSTLINAILGQKIAITTPKPQTTRKQQLGIFTTEKCQMLFMDTPGIHKPHNKLGEYMYVMAERALQDADILLWILDASEPPLPADLFIASVIQEKASQTPVVLALNKVDLLKEERTFALFKALTPHESAFPLSALTGDQVPLLVEHLANLLPLGPRYYPIDQVSDTNMRFIAAEVIREKILLNTEQEIPYSTAVEVDGYKEGADRTTISAIIYVERESQKGMVIGKHGAMIKTIGTAARQELIAMLEVPVHLELHVKVLKNWRDDEALMKRLGYRMPKPEDDKE